MHSASGVAVSRALISVSDKTGIAAFAGALHSLDIEILSTGGTGRLLTAAGIPVIDIPDYTGFPEMMGGRVKTLHPRVHGGILARRDQDQQSMEQYDIPPIDLVVVNLYPFEATVANPGCDLATAVANIDIGGPAMLRAAAKNHQFVAVVVEPADYQPVLQQLQANAGCLDQQTRFALAVKAFAHTARYDAAIADYLHHHQDSAPPSSFPEVFHARFRKSRQLRYGENPHQQAAFYTEDNPAAGSISTAVQRQGKALSYNNIADTDAALECVKGFAEPACVIVKHANPCGVAIAEDAGSAYDRAWQTDPVSAFGGILAFNRELDGETAQRIVEKQFAEVIIAPTVSSQALTITAQKANLRVLSCGCWQPQVDPVLDYHRVNGGLLVQQRDVHEITPAGLQVVSQRHPDEQELRDLLFAWQVCWYVKSNAIVYARNRQTIGIGAGQMSRVYSARIAAMKAVDAGLEVRGAVMASDAFFPFRDGIDTAAAAGITAVIQPGGSQRDQEVIAAADQADMAMVFTGVRHFRH